jgi:hypothetical protein
MHNRRLKLLIINRNETGLPLKSLVTEK